MRRRQFITLVGGAAGWPLAARAQQSPMPVVGFLTVEQPSRLAALVDAFRQGLGEAGYVEHRNVGIEYRWAEGRYDRLPALAADLVNRQVAAIAAVGGSIRAAKAATTTIPIVFVTGIDPVEQGIVASLNRPGGNITGVMILAAALAAKRIEMLRELAPKATVIGMLINPNYNVNAEQQVSDAVAAAQALGIRLHLVRASSERDFAPAFASLAQQKAGALMILADPFFTSRSEDLATLAERHVLPAIYALREFPEAGGLMSYGTSRVDAYRLAGVYVGRVLKGVKPADLPIVQPTKFELVINLKTAKTLGLDLPPKLLALADEVIE
jgi:putative ABC transport system substrate-binding protein